MKGSLHHPPIQALMLRPISVISLAGRRRDVAVVGLVSGVGYLLLFLYAIGNLNYQPTVSANLMVVAEPMTRMIEPASSRFTFEAVAVVDFWIVRLLFSPINLALGLVLGILVGLNMGLSYLAVVQPKSCGIGATTGLLASIPAVLAGGACCAPVLVILLGITVSGTFLTLISWLLPAGVVLLLLSLIYLTRQINPTALSN